MENNVTYAKCMHDLFKGMDNFPGKTLLMGRGCHTSVSGKLGFSGTFIAGAERGARQKQEPGVYLILKFIIWNPEILGITWNVGG